MVRLRIGNEELTLTWEELEARVEAGRVPPDALLQAPGITGDGWQRADTLEWVQALATSRSTAFARARSGAQVPWVTALLVGVQIRVWWWAQLADVGNWVERNTTKWTAPILEDGEVYRLFTMGFVHTSFTHALLNLVWLAYVGYHVERALGGRWLTVIYVASVGAGSVASMLGSPETPSLGASGGVFGLIAASVMFGLYRPELLGDRSRQVFGFALLPYLLLMFFSGLANTGTDNWAHAGGLVVGGLLALVADPPGFERRPGWSRRWQVGVSAALVAVAAAIYLLGPYAVPVADEAQLRADLVERKALGGTQLVPPPGGSFEAQVPRGWLPLTARSGGKAWSSPRGSRTWSVSERRLDQPGSAEAVWVAWQAERVAEGWPMFDMEMAEGELCGRPALVRRGWIDEDDPHVIEWRAAVRGTHAVVAVWVVERDQADRLAPLRERLFAAVQWPDPEELVAAAALAERDRPSGDAARRAVERLAEWGRSAEALRLARRLVEVEPEAPSAWVALLQATAWYPEEAPDREKLALDAYVADLGSRVDLAAVELLEALDDPRADAALDRAWADAPGDRTLLRARRQRTLSTVLLADGRAAVAAWDPLTGQPRPRDAAEPRSLDELQQRANTLATARGRAAADVRQALAEGRDPSAALLLLAWGHPVVGDAADPDLVKAIVEVASSDRPRWWLDSLPDPASVAPHIVPGSPLPLWVPDATRR